MIIPTLNEANSILATLTMAIKFIGDKEIIVVDGGSGDETVKIASGFDNVKIINASKGRANQMNAGAAAASGEILLFMHSDSILEATALEEIVKTLADKKVIGGCFTLRMDDDRFIFKLICLGSNIRAKFSKVYFGDQGIFVRKDIFKGLGGFPSIPLMEDWEFSRLLNKSGKTVQLPIEIITSPRRFEKGGILKTCLFMHKLKIQYLLGATPENLQKKYYDVR